MDARHIPFSNLIFRFILAITLLASASAPALATAGPAIEAYGALPTAQMMALSPDGKLLAFRRHSDEHDLLVTFSLEENAMVQAVDISAIKPQYIYFLDNTRVVLIASEDMRMFGVRGSLDVSTAFAVDAHTGNIDQLLTPGDNIFKAQRGLGRIMGTSADGTRVFMPAYVARSKSDRSPNYSLMEVNLESVKRPRVVESGSHYTINYFLDGDGKVLVEEIFHDRDNRHSIIAYQDGGKREIYSKETEIPHITVVGLTADRRHLIVVTESEATNRITHYRMSLSDGEMSDPIFARSDADVERVLTDVNQVAHGVVYSGLMPSYEFFDPSLNERMQTIVAQFPQQSVWLESWTPDWKHLLVKAEGTGSAGDYYLFSADAKPRFLASARPEIAAEQVNPVVTYSYEARDGRMIPALATIPLAHAENPQNLPAVMLPHGGPEAHDWVGFDWLAQALASRGYLVIQPQFRGSSGFGQEHKRAGRGEWGKKMQDDLTDGVNHVVELKMADPNRVCIAGISYGGYAALAGGAFTPEMYKCVVSVNGVTDIPRILKSEKSKHGRHHWVLSYWEGVIAGGNGDKQFLKDISPANAAERFTAPVLLVHGDKDEVVPFDQSKYMSKKLKRAKKQVTLVKLKGEGHQLSRSQTRQQMLEATLKFIDQHIGAPQVAQEL